MTAPTPDRRLTLDATAVDTLTEVALAGGDFADWLAHVLATVAARLGSTDALIAGRPGSWEADLVQRLVAGTVGYDDEHLADYGAPLLFCGLYHDHGRPVATHLVLRQHPVAPEAGDLLCADHADCPYCLDSATPNPAVLYDEEHEEPLCTEHAAQFADPEPVTGPEIVAIDSERYRELTAPADDAPAGGAQ
jgi:hypothetical protein